MSQAPRRKRLPPKERRAQLLAIAIDVFADRGLRAARHAEIAERAGVAVSTVFVYFPTRKALVEAVLAEVSRAFLEAIRKVHGQAGSCVEILEEATDQLPGLMQSHRSHVLVWLEWSSAVRNATWPRYRAFTEEVVAITRRTFERGQEQGVVPLEADPESLARLFASTSQSVARLLLGQVDESTVRRFQQTILRAVLADDVDLERASA